MGKMIRANSANPYSDMSGALASKARFYEFALTCTEPVTLETKRKSTKVKLKNITFRPDKALRSEIGVLKVKPLKLRNLTKKRLTDDEVKQKVVNYLRKNEFITRSVVQSICGMTRTTATRQIRRLCEENVLVNKGLQKQPIYFLKEKE